MNFECSRSRQINSLPNDKSLKIGKIEKEMWTTN